VAFIFESTHPLPDEIVQAQLTLLLPTHKQVSPPCASQKEIFRNLFRLVKWK